MESVHFGNLEIVRDEVFDIAEELKLLHEINERNFVVLERLCKKIDVTRKVLKVYNKKFLAMKEQQEELSRDEYLLLGTVLLLWAQERKEYKFVNSVFKLADLIDDVALHVRAKDVLAAM